MLDPLIAHWRERPQRTWSVVITFFGDAVLPRGGTVWLSTLATLFAAMDIDPGAVRTAMSRLVADGWTERTRVGRNSAYCLADKGQATFAAASERIYAGQPPPWDGRFTLVLDPPDRAALAAAGFGQAAPGLFVTAGAVAADAPIAMAATMELTAARRLAAKAWPLDRLAASFARFAATFAPVVEWRDPEPVLAMVARTLLIHEYRRVVLQAPNLPADVLPDGWPGAEARSLCAAAYAALLPASERWLTSQELPEAGPELKRRFRRHCQPLRSDPGPSAQHRPSDPGSPRFARDDGDER